MFLGDTIAAISTPPGRGGIGVLRLSGPDALETANAIFHSDSPTPIEPSRARFGRLVDPATGDRVDEAILTYFKSPHSYTGEDVVELSCHGSPVILGRALKIIIQRGLRIAEPGEFTFRAFFNKRIDLAQAQAVRDLVNAQTVYQARVAARQLEGALSKRLAPIKDSVIEVIVHLESSVEFVEEDISPDAISELSSKLDRVIQLLEETASSFSFGRYLKEGFELAIVGRPNVGKSSIFNRLIGTDRAIVTEQPGTTRDALYETTSISGVPVRLIDTAGIRETRDIVESLGIGRSRTAIADADISMLVLDASEALTDDDIRLLDQVPRERRILVYNKVDLVGDKAGFLEPAGLEVITISALTGHGFDRLIGAIFAHLAGDSAPEIDDIVVTDSRQEAALRLGIEHLRGSIVAIREGESEEVVLLKLHGALGAIGEVTGGDFDRRHIGANLFYVLHRQVTCQVCDNVIWFGPDNRFGIGFVESMTTENSFDVIVIGAGHAGCEAAYIAARVGARTALVTIDANSIGQMSCNPAIGGIAKGHLVREVDALGGIMGQIIDETGIQFRLLNRSRGPAVQSPRAQADRNLYRTEMRRRLSLIENLTIIEGEVAAIKTPGSSVTGIELADGTEIGGRSVVLTTGTFLNGLIHVGKKTFQAGRSGEPASIKLAACIRDIGFKTGRLKTGTPPRLDGRTIDFSKFERQPGDDRPVPFSFGTDEIDRPQIECFIGYTNEAVHDVIRRNLDKSPLYSGDIKGVGPRYCPSIEDKVVKFSEKPRHQIFLEPEGYKTYEIYPNGISTSLDEEVQREFVRTIPGLESVKLLRPGYAVEYDFVDPRELYPTLETKHVGRLFHAGQINGTSGYEEAAGQGIVAGINAALAALGREQVVLDRSASYIGVMVDDLVTKGADEPYRMFTSRAEMRLSLRYDNADKRLSPLGREVGSVHDQDYYAFLERQSSVANVKEVMLASKVSDLSADVLEDLALEGSPDTLSSKRLDYLARRPDCNPEKLVSIVRAAGGGLLRERDIVVALNDLRYAGYLKDEEALARKRGRYNELQIPSGMDFSGIAGLSHEVVQKLSAVRPRTIGQAARIPGITPAAVSILLVETLRG